MLCLRKTQLNLPYRLINDFPEVLETSSISKETFAKGTEDEFQMKNWNWMLEDLVYEYEGVDGLKTGTTDLAGYCFTGTAERDGTRYITVVMDAHANEGKIHIMPVLLKQKTCSTMHSAIFQRKKFSLLITR